MIFFSFNSVFAIAPPGGPTIEVDRTDFLLRYTMSGGSIQNATLDNNANSLIIGIFSSVDGQVTITLPRGLIDVKEPSGNDENFLVLVDDIKADFDETSTPEDRTLTIYFEGGAEEIEIIGSFVATLSSSLDEKTSDYKTIVIRGKMYENGTTVLDSDWFFTEKEPEIPFDNAGEIRILYYRDGEVVAETGFDYGPFCIVNGAMHCFDFMSLVLGIPYLDNIDKIVFSRSDNVLAEKIVSNNVPQVTVLYPNGGETFMVGQKVTIEWEGNDPDGDDLSYIVAYSRDGGKFWIPTTVGLEETEITGQFYSIDVTDSFSVKVIATDGFNTSFDTSDSTFSVTKYVSPKKQFDAGSASIICQEDFQLIFKSTDNSPVCVKPKTAEKLIERGGWESLHSKSYTYQDEQVSDELTKNTNISEFLNLPTNFEECANRGGYVSNTPSYVPGEGERCLFEVDSEQDPELYNQCTNAGGGLTVMEGSPPSYGCKIYYYESGSKCFGNFCD